MKQESVKEVKKVKEVKEVSPLSPTLSHEGRGRQGSLSPCGRGLG